MLGPPAPDPFDPSLLRMSGDLRRVGVDPGRSGWHRVRHGVWIPAAAWAGLTPEQRHAALVHATDLQTAEPGVRVYALASAAAVWGLPRVGRWPGHVTPLVTGGRRRGSRVLRPHVGAEADPVERAGLLVTSAARTVVDVARTESLPSALAAADHALRHDLCTREELAGEAESVGPRVRGRPAARLVAGLADPASMSAGESISRAWMFLLNLPRPRLQVAYEDAAGPIGVVDFEWDGVVGEFDGRTKYQVPADADPAEAADVVWREKQREDRLRRLVGVARWVWSDAVDGAGMARVLSGHGIRPHPRNTWLDGQERRAA
jgi:hypothetical protein